jgi:hypothetical protein
VAQDTEHIAEDRIEPDADLERSTFRDGVFIDRHGRSHPLEHSGSGAKDPEAAFIRVQGRFERAVSEYQKVVVARRVIENMGLVFDNAVVHPVAAELYEAMSDRDGALRELLNMRFDNPLARPTAEEMAALDTAIDNYRIGVKMHAVAECNVAFADDHDSILADPERVVHQQAVRDRDLYAAELPRLADAIRAVFHRTIARRARQ